MREAMTAGLVALSMSAAIVHATVVPYTEDFTNDSANWFNATGTAPLDFSAAGGPDGGSFAAGTFNFNVSTAGDTPVLLRAQDEFGSSGGAFVGNWLADGVTAFSAFVKHDAGVPLTFFTRFASPINFPGAVALNFAPIPSDTWTLITVGINATNPQFINFETSDFNTIFGNIGHVQVGVSVPDGLAGVDQTVTFSIDKVSVVPEPASIGGLALAVTGCVGRKRRQRQTTRAWSAAQAKPRSGEEREGREEA